MKTANLLQKLHSNNVSTQAAHGQNKKSYEYVTMIIRWQFPADYRVSKITCGFSKINCGMESWANGNSPKSVVGRNRWILNKKMVKKSGNRVTFGCLIWYKTYFLYYLNFGPFTACFLYGPLVLSVRKQTSFHGLGTAKMAAFFRCEKRKRFRICSKFP